jgi:hypothetical protein
MINIQHLIPDWNTMIHNDMTTVYTTNTRNIQADLEFNVQTLLYITYLTTMVHIDEQYV